jgi:tetrapyrrole methylase family protein/MazG family protein
VLYAVPGSPFVAERTVELLRADDRVEVRTVPSLSFVDLAWDRLGVDPVEAGVRLVDGHSFAPATAGQPGPFLVGQCDTGLVLSDVKLAVEDGPRVTVLQRLGLPDEAVFEVEWDDLDRDVEPDHLTCIWVPRMAAPVAAEITRFAELVRTLRAECPWDRAQTHQSLTRHLIEETYEVLDAIAALDGEEGYGPLEEELGDLLFQVASLAAEAGQFDLADVARGIHDKLVERHPHVFGPPGHPVPNWEEQKKAEKGRTSVMDGVPGNLPSLLHAFKVQSKAASVGFDWKNADEAWPKVAEELDELRAALTEGPVDAPAVNEELGDVLFSVVNIARHLGIDPESSLRAATAKFRARFAAMEALASTRGVPVDDGLWDEVKKRSGS